MTTMARRAARRMLEVFDYRTFAVAGAFLLVLLVGYVFYGAFQSAHDANVSAKSATDTANRRAAAASRRIDLLNAEIQRMQEEITAGSNRQGQLVASVAALQAQVRQLGGQPVITVTPGTTVIVSPSPAPDGRRPHPSPTPTPRPSPRSTPAPSPTPGGVCRLAPALC